jgi:exonuclease SbcD
LLILAGNHDSVSVLDESRELLTYLGAQVVSSTGDEARHVVTLPQRGTARAWLHRLRPALHPPA